jgi:hypothetical protein
MGCHCSFFSQQPDKQFYLSGAGDAPSQSLKSIE